MQYTRRAMTHVGIPVEEQDAVFQLVATVLHLGNLEFVDAGEHDSSQVTEASASALQAAAALLGVKADGLARALTTRTRHTVDGESVQGLQAADYVHAWTGCNFDGVTTFLSAMQLCWLLLIRVCIGCSPLCLHVTACLGSETVRTH